jgi:hypothetical protein
VKIGGVYILSRRSIARMLATITAALMMLYAATTAWAEATVHRIHDATVALVSLDRQMIGRLARTVVPDFMYLEYKSLYLELKPSVAAASAAPPVAARSASAPYQNGHAKARRGRRGSGLKGNRTRRMVDQLDAFKAWLLGNPVNERDSTKTVGARANAYWRLHEKTMARDAKRTGEKRGFSSAKTLASAYRNC